MWFYYKNKSPLHWVFLLFFAINVIVGSAYAQAGTEGGESSSAGKQSEGKKDENPGESSSSSSVPAYLQLRFGNSLGAGTFVIGPTWNPYYSSSLAVSSGFELGRFGFQADQQIWMEWTQSDETTSPYLAQMDDPAFAMRYGFLDVESWKTSGGASLISTLPLSIASRQAGSLGAAGAGLDLAYSIRFLWGLTPYFTATGMMHWIVPALSSRFAQEDPLATLTQNETESKTPSCIRRGEGELRNFSCADIPSIMNASFSTGFRQPLLSEKLVFEVGGSLLSYLSAYWGPDDAFTSQHAKPGPGQQHYTAGAAFLVYSPFDWLSFSGGRWSFQPLLTADGKGVRFPFWDFVSTRNNLSTFFFEVTITL
jgi:hypothetical protein